MGAHGQEGVQACWRPSRSAQRWAGVGAGGQAGAQVIRPAGVIRHVGVDVGKCVVRWAGGWVCGRLAGVYFVGRESN